MLRHIVSFRFQDETPEETITSVKENFLSLMAKIPVIHSFEWGTNCSTEGLNKGCTHVFLLTFLSEEDRDTYLVHEKHLEFATIAKRYLQDLFVIDFWANPVHRAENP